MQSNKHKGTAFILFLMIATAFGCKRTPEEIFQARAQQLRQRTTPAESTVSDPTAIMHSGTVARIEWQLNCPLSESAFRQFLSQQLEPEFSNLSSTHELIVYGRFAGGDSERIEITLIKKDWNTTQYAIRFSAMPG